MRKKVSAVLAALLAFGLVTASAASLGGLNTSTLGADTSVVASCDTDGITVDFTTVFTPNAGSGYYAVGDVVLASVAVACDTLTATVTLTDNTGTSLGSASAVVASGATIAFPGAVDAEAVTGVAVVIAG